MKNKIKVTNKQFIPIKTFQDDIGHHVVYPNFQKVITDNPIQNKIGQIILSIKFYKKNHSPIIEHGFSNLEDLSVKSNYNRQKTVAFKSAYKKIPFSPDSFEIVGEKFIYIDSTNTPLFENSIYIR